MRTLKTLLKRLVGESRGGQWRNPKLKRRITVFLLVEELEIGNNLQLNMSTAISNTEKTNILRKEFLEVELNHDELLTMDQFYAYLDRKAKMVFDRDVGEQLYSRMEKAFNGKISVDEFIKVFIQAEEILKNKIAKSKKMLLDYNRQRREGVNRFEEIRDCERVNQYGIKEDSQLTVELISGANFPNTSVQVMMQIENQKVELKASQGPMPAWNHLQTFNIFTGLEELQLFFYTIQPPSIPRLLGTVTISLSRLTNQRKISEWCQLFDKQGHQIVSKILLSLHWIYSEAKHLSQLILEWDEQIRSLETDLLDYERDLATLYQPFPSLVQVMRNAKEEDLKADLQPPNTMVITPVSNATGSLDLEIVQRIGIILNLALATVICFAKAQFLDIIMCLMFIRDFERKELAKQRYVGYCVSVGLSLLFDLLWAAKYSRGFWGTPETAQDRYFNVENGPNRLALILLYIQFLVKLVLMIVMGVLSQKAPEATALPQQTTQRQKLKQQSFQRNQTAQFGSVEEKDREQSTYYHY